MWIEAEAQDAVASERVAALLPLDRHGRALVLALDRCQGDLDGADDFGDVVGVDGGGGGFVEASEDAMEVGGAAGGGDVAEAFALTGLWRRGGKEAVDEGAEVEASASGDDGKVAAFGDTCEGFAGEAAVVPCGAGLVGPRDVDHVVRDEGALFVRGFGGADLHLAIDGDRVTADDLAVEVLSEMNGEGSFAAGGGPDEDDEWMFGRFYHRRHQPG